MKRQMLLAAIAAAIINPQSAPFAAADTRHRPNLRTVVITIGRIAAIDNMDANLLVPDRADFYVKAAVNGHWKRTETMFGKDRTSRAMQLMFPVSGSIARIHMQLFDDDGGIEGRDDRCDINPMRGARELDIVYNLNTGRISGDVSGYRGSPITVVGHGDANRARITFTIR